MNKKVIGKIAAMVGVLALLSLVIAKLYDIGVHRPSLAYRQLSPTTIELLNSYNRYNPESIMKAGAVGPFDWDNKQDIGQTRSEGKWAHEEDANSIVYYRKDRDAKGQINARRVLDCMDNIIRELPAYLGTYHYPADLNGRKIPVYVPKTADEYLSLLNKMSDNGSTGSSKYGCSIIAIGPLGCQNKGIILHPDAFTHTDANGDPEFIHVLRRELAYYTYLAGLNYNVNAHRFAWFIQGITENFALDGQQLSISPAEVTQLARECILTGEFPAKGRMSQWAGTAFIQFYERTYGSEALKSLIATTYKMPVDSAFMQLQLNTDSLKYQWVESLKSMNYEAAQE